MSYNNVSCVPKPSVSDVPCELRKKVVQRSVLQMVHIWGALVISGFTAPSAASAFSGDGAGLPGNPFQIGNVRQLQEMMDELGAVYILTRDIDASETAVWNAGTGFSPVGQGDTPFRGRLDGAGHAIVGLVIKRPEWGTREIGLFGSTADRAHIHGVHLIDPKMEGCNYVGALVGRNGGSLTQCFSWGGSITAAWCGGGLVGVNRRTGAIQESASSVALLPFGAARNFGGLTGQNDGSITDSFATGDVLANGHVGGLVGVNGGLIQRGYATGVVGGMGGCGAEQEERSWGGLVGSNRCGGRVEACFGTAILRAPQALAAGALVGQNGSGASIRGSFFHKPSKSITPGVGRSLADAGLVEIEAVEGPLSAFFVRSRKPMDGWAFGTMWVFKVAEGLDYPCLKAGCRFSGKGRGTELDPYQITDVRQLQEMKNDLDAHYILMHDIDAAESAKWNPVQGKDGRQEWRGFFPVGDDVNPFRGCFDGRGRKVSGLTIKRFEFVTRYIGLWGAIGLDARVVGLHLEDVTVEGCDAVGGVVGWNRGVVSGCAVHGGAVRGSGSCGGMVGVNHEGAVVSECSASVEVDLIGVGNHMGGLVGVNSGLVVNCRSTGNVRGLQNPGGLVGALNGGTIRDCFASGKVSSLFEAWREDYRKGCGGLVGQICGGKVEGCFATGEVQAPTGYPAVGALVGVCESGGAILNTYCLDMSGRSAVGVTWKDAGVIEVHAVDKSVSPFLHKEQSPLKDWDWESAWSFPVAEGIAFPVPLKVYRFSGKGEGTEARPYLIADLHQLEEMRNVPEAHYALVADVDARASKDWDGGRGFASIGTALRKFTGSLDGRRFTIRGLVMNRAGQEKTATGLFGYTARSARLMNIHFADAAIAGHDNVGALAAFNDGDVSRCFVWSGAVKGNSFTGGWLAGRPERIQGLRSRFVLCGGDQRRHRGRGSARRGEWFDRGPGDRSRLDGRTQNARPGLPNVGF